MKKTMMRTLSLVLTICLIAGLLVVPAAATVENAAAAVATLKSALELEASTADTAISFSRLAPESGDLEAFGTQPDAAKSYVQGLISSAIEAQLDVEGGMSGVTVTVTSATYTAEDTDTSVGSIAYEAALSVGEDPDATTANIGGTITLTKSATEPDPTPETYAITTADDILHGHITVTVADGDVTHVAAGATVTVTATADSGYELDKITVTKADDDTTTVAVNEDGTFTMPAYDVKVSATFKDAAYAITVNAGEHGSASASATEATMGTAITLTITPDGGYEVDAVTVNDNPLDAQEDGAYTFNMPGQAVTVNVTFRATQVTTTKEITFTVAEGVTVNPADTSGNPLTMTENKVTVGKDAIVTFTLDVADGYTLGTVTGAESSASGVYTVTADAVTITATQTAPATKYGITVTAGANGTATADKAEAAEGEKVTLTITPEQGYELDQVTGVTLDDNNQFTMPAEAVTVNVTFKKVTYTITVNAGANGSATADKTEAAEGEKVTLTITPEQGYELDQVTGVTLDENNQFTMPGEAVTVTVTFVAVDKTALNAAIADADAAAKAITVATSADEVAKGAKWILQSDLDTYNTAIAAADTVAKKAAATQDEVDNAVKALATATTVFEEAQKEGTNENVVDKTELKAKYNEVKAAVEAAVEAADGSNVPTDAQWITMENRPLADRALGEVKIVIDNTNATADEVAEALTKLATVEGYLQPGTKVPEATKYNVSVTDGTADKATAAEGESVTVTADAAPTGKVFDKWTATGLTLSAEDAAKAELTFTMPAGDVALTATYKDETVEPTDPAVKDASIVFITKDNYEALAPTYNYYGATEDTLRPAADVQLPWLLVSYVRNEAGTVTFAVTKDGQAVQFGSGDDKSDTLSFEAATANANAWVSFHMVSQAETDHKDQTWLDQADAEGEYEVTVTMGEDTATATATYTIPEADKTELVAAIAAAQAMLDAAQTAESGAEVLKTDFWATAAEKAALTKAIADAQAVADNKKATEAQVADAVTALETNLETNLHPGEKAVTMADLTAAIEAADAAAKAITVAESAASVKKGTEFVTAAVKADYVAAIEAAKAVADNAEATDEEIEAALAALNEATLIFNAAKQTGTKNSSSGRPNYGGGTAGNTTTTDKKTETLPDGTKRETETAKDGTVTVTDTLTDGTKTVTTTAPTGEITTTVTLGRNTESVQVAVPVENATGGMVAVIVKSDGTEEIIRDSAVVDDEVIFDLDEDATVKIVNKAKNFVDVSGHWARNDVDFVTARDLFNGVSSTHFAPDATMTRGMMATVLFRLDGEGKVDKAVDFSDVTADDWFAESVNWAAEIGMITGYTDGSFGPDRSITREELVVMIYRYAGTPAVEGQDMEKFDDADSVSDWATAAMTWAIRNGIINGKTATTIDPKGNATRAEVSAVLQRYVKLAK